MASAAALRLRSRLQGLPGSSGKRRSEGETLGISATIDKSREVELTLKVAKPGRGSKVAAMKEAMSPSCSKHRNWFRGTPRAFQQKILLKALQHPSLSAYEGDGHLRRGENSPHGRIQDDPSQASTPDFLLLIRRVCVDKSLDISCDTGKRKGKVGEPDCPSGVASHEPVGLEFGDVGFPVRVGGAVMAERKYGVSFEVVTNAYADRYGEILESSNLWKFG